MNICSLIIKTDDSINTPNLHHYLMLLDKDSVSDVLELIREHNHHITEEIITQYCNNTKLTQLSVHIYGHYIDKRLISVMTATFMLVMPHDDSPSGRIVHISGAYTDPHFRHQNIASNLLKEIEHDAKQHFHADYICCDSTADNLYISNGFIKSSESRLWKRLN
jgi:ribosomal protein S18 acetylase RimI-like enzyme